MTRLSDGWVSYQDRKESNVRLSRWNPSILVIYRMEEYSLNFQRSGPCSETGWLFQR